MIEGNLFTTNILLAVIAAVSVLQALVLIGVGVMAFRLYRQTLRMVRDIEQRRIAPLAADVTALMAKVDGILADVKDVTARVHAAGRARRRGDPSHGVPRRRNGGARA